MYQEIIDEIKTNLCGNKDIDRKYLVSQLDNYKGHEYESEIIREISRMLWDCLSEEEKNEFAEVSQKENPIRDILNEINDNLVNDELNIAFEKLDSFMKTFPELYADDKVSEYHSFGNPLEELLFEEYVGAEKELRYVPDYIPLIDLYYIYGFLLFDKKQLKKSESYLKKALKLNPVSTTVILELSEIYKATDLNKFLEYTLEALKYAYKPQSIGRAYRNLGYYCVEENKFETAIALYVYSLKYEYGLMAFTELEYIKSKGYFSEINSQDAIKILEENNIQIGPNPKIFELIDYLINDLDKNNLFDQELYFLNIKYELTNDEEINNKIKELEHKL